MHLEMPIGYGYPIIWKSEFHTKKKDEGKVMEPIFGHGEIQIGIPWVKGIKVSGSGSLCVFGPEDLLDQLVYCIKKKIQLVRSSDHVAVLSI